MTSHPDPHIGTSTAVAEHNGDVDAAAAPTQLLYPSLEQWVSGWLVRTYRRSLGGHHLAWCPEWWRHAEAISRLEAMWRAWEHLRLDPSTGMSVWFRDHCDPHMAVLLSPDGPFKGCDPERGHRASELPALPVIAPPEGLFST